mgnify:CR=1 FL=1
MSQMNQDESSAANENEMPTSGPPSGHHSTASALPTSESPARSQELIEKRLDEFFEAFQDAFTNYDDDLKPREAFIKHLTEEYGVDFPSPDINFGVGGRDSGAHGILTGGRGGGIITATDFAIDHHQGLVDGGLNRLDGWHLSAIAEREPVLRFADTEDVGSDLQRQAPNDAHDFVQAMLEHYDNTADGGSGNNAIDKGLKNILEKPDFLAWALEALTEGDRSVVEVAAVLGGGTGGALTILCDELARLGHIGQGEASVGFTLGMQMGRVANDVHLGQFDDGSARYTFHDAYAIADRVGQRIRDDDAAWALWTENIPLTYNYWALQNNPDYGQIRDFYWPIRKDANPISVERAVATEPRFSNLGHTERDRILCLGSFAFRQLKRRPARTQFWKGEEDYDLADFKTDYEGYVWTPGFDAVHDFSELEGRDIPGLDTVTGHREALHALGHTASGLLSSNVSHGEIQRVNAVVHAADIDVNGSDLQIVEDAIMNALDLGYDQTGERDNPVRAVLMDGLGTENYPSNYPLSVTVYAGHELALDAHNQMATSEYKRAVTSGGGA